MADKIVLFWHRKDLRILDNLGLNKAFEISKKVVGIFCLDPNILDCDDIAPIRLEFMLRRLNELQKEYQKAGGKLYIFYKKPEIIIPHICQTLEISEVFWNLDVEPYAKLRDRKVFEGLEKIGVKANYFWDQLLHAPDQIKSQNGTSYTVFTPFFNNWYNLPKPEFEDQTLEFAKLSSLELRRFEEIQKTNWENFTDTFNQNFDLEKNTKKLQTGLEKSLLQTNRDLVAKVLESDLVESNLSAKYLIEHGQAWSNFLEFLGKKVDKYGTNRDLPSIEGTSGLSVYLKFGVLSIRQIWQELEKNVWRGDGVFRFKQELAWREFYQHSMFNFPRLEVEPFRESFKNFDWDFDVQKWQSWIDGKTSFPLVDAGMRQLKATGWMHNRVRMVVASFLTKDLLIDWRYGEKYFMQTLIDGDLSSNNGGWQWSASCGLDPKPLRIFNPVLQAQKYDPEAKYILKWLPELAGLDPKMILTNQIPSFERQKRNYLEPIVDHKIASGEFKKRYQEIKINPSHIAHTKPE